MNQFEKLTVILPVMDEVESLRKTVETLIEENRADLYEILFVVSRNSLPASLLVCKSYESDSRTRFRTLVQTRPLLGGAFQDAFEIVSTSHTLMMSSDLETDPKLVKQLIIQSKRNPDHIVAASRWLQGGGFHGYGRVKLPLNFVFQRFFSFLYGVRMTDMTFGFRIFPTEILKQIRWEEHGHPFLFESLIKPLKLGVHTIEVSTQWYARIEGQSHNSFFKNFAYFLVGIKTYLKKRNHILR